MGKIFDFLAKLNTHSRYPDSSRDTAYTRSYRFMRLAVGVLGIALPIFFIIGEAFFLRGGVHVRGSLSAYYHSPMQDVFVAVLCVIGFLLVSYMVGERGTADFWASLIAGVAVIGVVFFPTTRSGLPPNAALCGSNPEPAGCSPIEQTLGEHQTAVIHGICAIVFIVFLAIMSFLFAISEILPEQDRNHGLDSRKRSPFRKPGLFWIHLTCTLIILAAGAWAFWGAGVWQLTRLYIGEVASVWAFGLSWIVAGLNMTAPARAETTLGVLSGHT